MSWLCLFMGYKICNIGIRNFPGHLSISWIFWNTKTVSRLWDEIDKGLTFLLLIRNHDSPIQVTITPKCQEDNQESKNGNKENPSLSKVYSTWKKLIEILGWIQVISLPGNVFKVLVYTIVYIGEAKSGTKKNQVRIKEEYKVNYHIFSFNYGKSYLQPQCLLAKKISFQVLL